MVLESFIQNFGMACTYFSEFWTISKSNTLVSNQTALLVQNVLVKMW
jgi:hypothetical protein